MDLFQMDFFIYILILMLLVGAFFVVYGSLGLKGAKSEQVDDGQELLVLAQKLDTLESSVYEADEAVHMLGDMSKNVFKEFDSKYQELLFLYNLVDEKQKNLTLIGNAETMANEQSSPDPTVVRDMLFPAGSAPSPKQKMATVTRPIASKSGNVPQITPGGGLTSIDIKVDDSTRIKPSGINPKFANVLQLSKEGKSVEDIARELDMGKGEVTLILNLGGRPKNA